MRISDWSSDVCSSDLRAGGIRSLYECLSGLHQRTQFGSCIQLCWVCWVDRWTAPHWHDHLHNLARLRDHARGGVIPLPRLCQSVAAAVRALRSDEHPSELQSLMRISYAVLCLIKKQ